MWTLRARTEWSFAEQKLLLTVYLRLPMIEWPERWLWRTLKY